MRAYTKYSEMQLQGLATSMHVMTPLRNMAEWSGKTADKVAL